VSRTLLVTQPTRRYGEFRKPWVRAVYARYVASHRRALARAIARLAPAGELTVLAARELVDPQRLPAGVAVSYLDEQSLRVDAEKREAVTRTLTSAWWPSREEEPVLEYRKIFLPDLLSQVRGTVLWLEISEPLAIARKTLDDTKPDRVVLLSGASVLERLARRLAERRGLPVEVAAPGFLWPRIYAGFVRALQYREERMRLGDFLTFPRRKPVLPAGDGARRILFVTCRARHHFIIDPLAAAVRSAGAEPRVIITPVRDPELTAKVEGLAAQGIACDSLADYLPAAGARTLVRRHRPLFRALWRRIERRPGFAQALEVEGLPLADIARPILRDSVERTLLVALCFQEAACRALDTLRPAAVVVTSPRRYAERALALAAREREIPVLLFSGTLLMGRDDYNFFDAADRLLVIGEHLKSEIVRQQHVAPELITVVGDPRSDAARSVPTARLRQEVFRDFQLSPGRPLFVFVSKYVSSIFGPSEKEAFYRTMIGALALLDQPHVIVKVHPNEETETLRRQIADWGWPGAPLTKDYDIHRLFGAADAAVMVTSMAGLEAMSLGCPVVAVQAHGKDYDRDGMPPYVSEGAAERIDLGDSAALAAALRRIVTQPEVRASLVERGARLASRYLHPVDGELGERLLAVVNEVSSDLAQARAR
jgi:glycosyltransferase involved in cell wall biosynthesis